MDNVESCMFENIQIMAGVMMKSSLTTIERRFNLPTTTTALLASSFQIGTLTTLLFISYFGSRWHRYDLKYFLLWHIFVLYMLELAYT